MAQDSDVARMAAALRTPSLRYRSFGNEPVRNPAPREQVEAVEDFPLLGEALAAIDSLPPEASVLPPAPQPVAPEPVRTVTVPPSAPTTPAVMVPPVPPPMDPPAFAPSPLAPPVVPRSSPVPPSASIVAPSAPPVFPPAPRPAMPAPVPRPVMPSAPVLTRPPIPAAPGAMPSLLQTLLAEAPPRTSGTASAPIVVGRHPPQAPVPPPGSTTLEPILPSAPPIITTRGLASPPVPPPPNPRDAMGWTGGRSLGPGSGSSLLDTLVGRGDPSQSATQYPLLDALTAAMRSDLSGASSRVWPAARVEMALPELLRRVAAGVRSGRGLV